MITSDLSLTGLAARGPGTAAPPWYAGQMAGGSLPSLACDFTAALHAAAGTDRTLAQILATDRPDPKAGHGPDGTITLAAVGTALTDAPWPGGGPVGLRIDPPVTNLLENAALTGSGSAPTGWTRPSGSGVSAPAPSLLGAADGAASWLQDAAGQRPFLQQVVPVAANTSYVFSFLLEELTGTPEWDHLAFIAGMPSGSSRSYRANGQPVGQNDTATGPALVEIVLSTGAQGGAAALRMGLGAAANSNGSCRLSRPQFEVGTRRAPFVPTATGPVTRAGDRITATAPATWLGTGQGCALIEAILDEARGAAPVLWALDRGADRLVLMRDTVSDHLVLLADLGGTLASVAAPAPAFGTALRAALTWENGRIALAVNGGAVAGWTGPLAIPVFTGATLGGTGAGSDRISGRIARVFHWPVALDGIGLSALSA